MISLHYLHKIIGEERALEIHFLGVPSKACAPAPIYKYTGKFKWAPAGDRGTSKVRLYHPGMLAGKVGKAQQYSRHYSRIIMVKEAGPYAELLYGKWCKSCHKGVPKIYQYCPTCHSSNTHVTRTIISNFRYNCNLKMNKVFLAGGIHSDGGDVLREKAKELNTKIQVIKEFNHQKLTWYVVEDKYSGKMFRLVKMDGDVYDLVTFPQQNNQKEIRMSGTLTQIFQSHYYKVVGESNDGKTLVKA